MQLNDLSYPKVSSARQQKKEKLRQLEAEKAPKFTRAELN
jgi:hypothetical protein